jgi:hypothetical protein
MDERTPSKIGGDMCDFNLGAHLERVGATYPCRVHKSGQAATAYS